MASQAGAQKKNVIQISMKRNAPFFIYLSKLFLKDFHSVELHALGEAIAICVRVAEQLERFHYVKITKIETLTYVSEHEGRNGEKYQRKKVKMIVIVEKSAEFDKLMVNFKPPQGAKK
jgi:DNA-binding protein